LDSKTEGFQKGSRRQVFKNGSFHHMVDEERNVDSRTKKKILTRGRVSSNLEIMIENDEE